MDHLRTDLAPLSAAAWEQVKEEATRTLRTYLAGRALVDVGHACPSTRRRVRPHGRSASCASDSSRRSPQPSARRW